MLCLCSLLDQYFDRKHTISQNEPERFKIVGSVNNWDDAKLPNMLAGFNGKPTLVTKSGMWSVRTVAHTARRG